MNFIAGYLLIITKDEEKSFWLMDALIGRILPGMPTQIFFGHLPFLHPQALLFPYTHSGEMISLRHVVDYYSPAMLGLKTDQEVLGDLVNAKAPAVGQLMSQFPGIWTLVVSRWFICLYIDVLPVEVGSTRGLGAA